MPTGYTAGVQDGKITEFKDFALQCARAFGALVMMRDDPTNAPIPERFEPSSYYADAIAQAEQELARFRAMPVAEAEKERDVERRKRIDDKRASEERRRVERERYETMLAKVQTWAPPSTDHAEMKKFMTQQLTDSIKWDCGDYSDPLPTLPTPADWLLEKIDGTRRRLESSRKHQAEEIERTEGRNRWIQQLRDSLK